MSDREKILTDLRAAEAADEPLPDLSPEAWIVYDDPRQQFIDVLKTVGGAAHVLPASQLPAALEALRQELQAQQVVSTLPEAPGTVELENVDDPHDLESIDLCVTRGEFAVAENGAIWVTDQELRQRVVLFLAQHLALVVPAAELVTHLHEAYARLEFSDNRFGVFISGPSKTADIEQSLVIGAHGARSLNVYLVQ